MTKYLTNNFSIIYLFKKPSTKSEIVTQMIFGDSFSVSKWSGKWLKIKVKEAGYKGFVQNKNFSNLNVLTLFTIFIASISLLFVPDKSSIANSTFINSLLTKYIKLFILILAFLVVYISSNYLKRNQIYFFEYPVLLLFWILGMFVMTSANDLIVL